MSSSSSTIIGTIKKVLNCCESGRIWEAVHTNTYRNSVTNICSHKTNQHVFYIPLLPNIHKNLFMVLAYRIPHFTSRNVDRLCVKLQKYTNMTSNTCSGKKQQQTKRKTNQKEWIHILYALDKSRYSSLGMMVQTCWFCKRTAAYKGPEFHQTGVTVVLSL